MKITKLLLITMLAMTMLLSLLTSCTPRSLEQADSPSSSHSEPLSSLSDESTVGSIIPDFLEDINGKKEQNSDTIGWLRVPDTGIDDVVVCDFNDNQYYHRRDFEKQYSFEGLYYADHRSYFGDGNAEELGVNTCIYGHSLTDDPEHDNYTVKFAQLHNFRDEKFAREHPYMFFSTEHENLAFEIIAVFVANSDNPDVPYNRNDIVQEEFVQMVRKEILPRSKYVYDVEIRDDDKFLVLSTCIYKLDNGTKIANPRSTNIRYAVMGRLANPNDPLKDEAAFNINEDVIIDPDGKWNS